MLSLCQSFTRKLPHQDMLCLGEKSESFCLGAQVGGFGKRIITCAKIYICFSARYRKYLCSWPMVALTFGVAKSQHDNIFVVLGNRLQMSSRKSLSVYRMFADLFSTHCSKSKIESFSCFLKIYFSILFLTTSSSFFSYVHLIIEKYYSSGSLCFSSFAKLLGYLLKRLKQDFGLLETLLGP